MTISVVLVEPAGPLNIGSVARLCANFGVDSLRLVNPRCEVLCDEALRMAVHAAPVLRQATIHPDLQSAISDCKRVIATCGRLDHGLIPLQPPMQRSVVAGRKSPYAMVFGREDRGLTNDELRLCQRVLTLHSQAAYPSLNLSHAVAVVLHDLARHQLKEHALTEKDPAPAPQLTGCWTMPLICCRRLDFCCPTPGSPHGQSARSAATRRLQNRGGRVVPGMVRQVRWAIRADRP
ncbi:MAG: tRNA (cytidine/uridine-2'-O-)-methyltransferase TrmJ [Synechococcus sp.]|nr:MAG: tRNA (cytidine/uridine-2'-O-)-methyltransferase TrmJ [Synechococcus sp.]